MPPPKPTKLGLLITVCFIFKIHLTLGLPSAYTNNEPHQAAKKYLEYYSLMRKAKKNASAGNYSQAAETYEQARILLDEIVVSAPDWRPDLLNAKHHDTEKAINLIEQHQKLQKSDKFLQNDKTQTNKETPHPSPDVLSDIPDSTTKPQSLETPEQTFDLEQTLTKLWDEAELHFMEGRLDHAAQKYEQILKHTPEDASALANYGMICQLLGRTDTALKALEHAVNLSPNDAVTLHMLGVTYCMLGEQNPANYQKAFEVLHRAAQLSPENPSTRNYLGITAFNLNKPEIAERELRNAIQIRSDYSVAHINLAIVYASQKPPALELARHHYMRAIQLGHPRHVPTEQKINISENDLPISSYTNSR